MGKIFLIFSGGVADKINEVAYADLILLWRFAMAFSKLIIVSDDPIVIHRGQEFAQNMGVQCEVQSPSYSSQGMPSLSAGSNPLSMPSNVLQFPTGGTNSNQVSTINDLEAQAIEKAKIEGLLP